MSELNRVLLSAYRLGATAATMKTLGTQAAHRVHRYLLDGQCSKEDDILRNAVKVER